MCFLSYNLSAAQKHQKTSRVEKLKQETARNLDIIDTAEDRFTENTTDVSQINWIIFPGSEIISEKNEVTYYFTSVKVVESKQSITLISTTSSFLSLMKCYQNVIF